MDYDPRWGWDVELDCTGDERDIYSCMNQERFPLSLSMLPGDAAVMCNDNTGGVHLKYMKARAHTYPLRMRGPLAGTTGHAAQVICMPGAGSLPLSTYLRLVGGSGPNWGTVEALRFGTWAPLCGHESLGTVNPLLPVYVW